MTEAAFSSHDHKVCIADAMALAEAECQRQGLRFTPVRRRVLELLLHQHRALGAYEILAILDQEGFGKQPPLVYRALDFLLSLGVVHRIEKKNAYVACTSPGARHLPAFMICRTCDAVAETAGAAMTAELGAAARAAGFAIEATVLEAEGLCPDCQEDDDAAG